jgi:hypothetical protein
VKVLKGSWSPGVRPSTAETAGRIHVAQAYKKGRIHTHTDTHTHTQQVGLVGADKTVLAMDEIEVVPQTALETLGDHNPDSVDIETLKACFPKGRIHTHTWCEHTEAGPPLQ